MFCCASNSDLEQETIGELIFLNVVIFDHSAGLKQAMADKVTGKLGHSLIAQRIGKRAAQVRKELNRSNKNFYAKTVSCLY